MIGFTGARHLSPEYRPIVARIVNLIGGIEVAVGCQHGLDEMVRELRPDAAVFRAADYGQGAWAYALRSQKMIEFVGRNGGKLIAFPDKPCPDDVKPGPNFYGAGNGTWATIAFAIRTGVPAAVFPCGFEILPAWGEWIALGGKWDGGFRFVPPAKQMNFF